MAVTGCSLARLNVDVAEFDASTVLVGRVEPGVGPVRSVVVGAYARQADTWRLAHQVRLHEPGGYELIVPHGSYRLFAFDDRNGNGLHDPGEPAATLPDEVVAVPGQSIVAGLDLTLDGAAVAVPRVAAAGPYSTQAGAIADLDLPAFSAERGVQGYWQPMVFFRSQGGNVYFLEPYAPDKTPVLFVHGAVGSPQDWRLQIDRLDRTRFQPWVYFYPSGAPVDSMASLLGWKLLNLQLRHRFERLVIVAHSMGGLVSRRFLLDQGAALPQVRRFVSISTPWAGEPSADTGVRMSPAVVPSWRDMQPGGPFLNALFSRRLPAGIEFDLLFGHKGGYSLTRPNHDGTVTLASQLRPEAQQEARLVFGYDEDHTSILRSDQVSAQLRALLAASADAARGARLDVRLAYPDAPPVGLPLLVLEPANARDAPVTVTLSAGEGGGRVGPLPPGTYRAGLVAPGFAAEPRMTSVTVAADDVSTLVFRLRPEGSLSGFVRGPGQTPAGTFVPTGAEPRLRTISLAGAGFVRTLSPRADGPSFARIAGGEDEAAGSSFFFAGLPEGEYELTVVADGFVPHHSRHRVVPGQAPPIAAIVLEPAR